VDKATHEQFLRLPDLPLGAQLRQALDPVPATGDAAPVAKLRLSDDRNCPMLTGESLCRLQQSYGDAVLPHVCRVFPRLVCQEHGAAEAALTFACPEAARHVLLNPDLRSTGLRSAAIENNRREQTVGDEDATRPLAHFWRIRSIVLELIGNRGYPLWQRLFLIDLLCHRLDQIQSGSLAIGTAEFLQAFEAAVARGQLRAGMEALPVNPAAQLDMVLQMAGMMLHPSGVLAGFAETVAEFTGGIGNGPGATFISLTQHYNEAYRLYFAPYFAARPHILENYLINTVFRCRFPFGAHEQNAGAPRSMVREFDKLLAQFALIKGLLIGVAGHHRGGFTSAHVVRTFQSAAKHFEHHPAFFDRTLAVMAECRMTGGSGCSILARNDIPAAATHTSIHVPQAHVSSQPQVQMQTGPA
jgi:lysine-N-methylase